MADNGKLLDEDHDSPASDRELLRRVDNRSMEALHAIGQIAHELGRVREDISDLRQESREAKTAATDASVAIRRVEAKVRTQLASVPDIATDAAVDAITASRIVPPGHSRSDFPVRFRRALRDMVGGGVLNLAWVVLGGVVTALVIAWLQSHK